MYLLFNHNPRYSQLKFYDHENFVFNSSICYTTYPIWVAGELAPIPADRQEAPWTGLSIYHGTYSERQPFAHTFTPLGNLE